jgi:hypothetical protein
MSLNSSQKKKGKLKKQLIAIMLINWRQINANRILDAFKLTNFKETLASWKNGNRRVLKTGRRTRRKRKKEKWKSWSLISNKPKNIIQ